MEIYVRNNDGFVLNSYQFNSSFPGGINNGTMYAGEDCTIYDISDIPNDPDQKYYFKNYYYKDGVLELKYILETYEVEKEIDRLKKVLSDSDYIVIKSYEATMIGQPVEYNMGEIHVSRQELRDKINELEELLNQEGGEK